jgi:hypothetical protein
MAICWRWALFITLLTSLSSLAEDSLPSAPEEEPKLEVRRTLFDRDKRPPPDISQLPLDTLEGPHRQRALEIMTKPVSWYDGRQEMFPCDQQLLDWLIRHPDVVGEYWKAAGISITDVKRIPGGYLCEDPSGSTVHFHVVCDQPNLRICYCVGEAPAGVLPVKMRAELVIVHQFHFEEYPGAGTYVSQQLDGFATAVELCVQEMKTYFSVMCRLMQIRPHWSIEKLPLVAQAIEPQDRTELEGILKTLPPTHRSLVARPDGKRPPLPTAAVISADQKPSAAR